MFSEPNIPPTRKGKKLKKRHRQKNHHNTTESNLKLHQDQYGNLPEINTPLNQPTVVPIVNESTLFSKNYREQHPTGIIREEFTSHDHGLENNEGAFAEAQEKADKSLNGLDLTEFKLRFKQSALLFHYADDVSKVPIYLKGSVLFITLLEKLHQTFREFTENLQGVEKQFTSDMSLYLTYFSLISVSQTIHLKKIFHQKGAESLHTKRAAYMAKVFHSFLRKNCSHWK